jgi:hypothetical protein
MRLPNTAHTSRLTWISALPTAALAAGTYLKARVARTKLTFATPPPDSMGP